MNARFSSGIAGRITFIRMVHDGSLCNRGVLLRARLPMACRRSGSALSVTRSCMMRVRFQTVFTFQRKDVSLEYH